MKTRIRHNLCPKTYFSRQIQSYFCTCQTNYRIATLLAHAPVSERAPLLDRLDTDAPEVYCDINNIGAPAVFDYFSKRGFSALGACAKKHANTVTVGPFMFSLHINRILQICKTEKRNVQQYAGAWSVWIILYQQQT